MNMFKALLTNIGLNSKRNKDFKRCRYMKVDKEKLKNANYVDILREIATVTEELDNMMYSPSWARTNELIQYKKELLEELDRRK